MNLASVEVRLRQQRDAFAAPSLTVRSDVVSPARMMSVWCVGDPARLTNCCKAVSQVFTATKRRERKVLLTFATPMMPIRGVNVDVPPIPNRVLAPREQSNVADFVVPIRIDSVDRRRLWIPAFNPGGVFRYRPFEERFSRHPNFDASIFWLHSDSPIHEPPSVQSATAGRFGVFTDSLLRTSRTFPAVAVAAFLVLVEFRQGQNRTTRTADFAHCHSYSIGATDV